MLQIRHEPAPRRAARVFAWGGAVAFALSLAYFLYSYLVRFGVPADHDSLVRPVVADVLLFTAFALHHSAMARPPMKAWVNRLASPALERALYTWVASLLFVLVCGFWQPVPGTLYRAEGPAAWTGYALQLLGVLVTARSSARLDVLDLAGVRRLGRAGAAAPLARVPLATTGLYGLVRHPVYLGWVLMVFGAPHMTLTRFVFAVVSTVYLAVGIHFEERTLIETFGPEYVDYQKRVRWRMIPGVY